MNCWLCNADLIWGGDTEVEGSEDYDIETNFSCPECRAFVLVYHPKDKEGNDDGNN